MSRLGKRAIEIPSGVTVTISDKPETGGVTVVVKGSKGELSRDFTNTVKIEQTDEGIVTTPAANSLFAQALWGTYSSHLRNMIVGVTEGFEKKLVVEGTGFKSEVKGKQIVLSLGFSHPVEMGIPEGLTVTAEKNEITISGINKEVVGRFAANLRAKKKPEPYKGKGIRYIDEVIERKQGKKSVG